MQTYHLGVFENILIHDFNYLSFERQLQIILSINDYHCFVFFFILKFQIYLYVSDMNSTPTFERKNIFNMYEKHIS